MEKNITVEKIQEKASTPTFGETHKVFAKEVRKDEAGNEYEFTRVNLVSVSMLQTQRDNLQKQMDAIDEQLASIGSLK